VRTWNDVFTRRPEKAESDYSIRGRAVGTTVYGSVETGSLPRHTSTSVYVRSFT